MGVVNKGGGALQFAPILLSQRLATINVIFVGGTLQLQPVSGNPVFEKITKKTNLNELGCVTSVNIWRDSVIYNELTMTQSLLKCLTA